MQRTRVGLIRRTPSDWRDILTHDPTRPKDWISTISALIAAAFLLVVLFSLAVVLIWPFLLIWHITPYPNLATVSFTTFLVAGSLFLLATGYMTFRLFRYWLLRWFPGDTVIIWRQKIIYGLKMIVKITAALIFAALAGYFLFRVSQDALAWLNFDEKLVIIYQQFFEWLFKIFDLIGLSKILPT